MFLFVSLLCIIVAVWILLQFAPQVHLDIFINDTEDNQELLTATITVQNTSRGRLTKQTLLLQNLAYGKDKAAQLTDLVPFKTSSVKSGEEPLAWHEPREICKEVLHLFPGETVTTEVLLPCPQEAAIVHVGLQFNSAPGPLENLIGRFFTLNNRWETSAIHLMRPAD